jgi:hypothetical protein
MTDPKITKTKLNKEIDKLSVKADTLSKNSKVYLASDVKHFEGSKEVPKGAFYHAGDLPSKTKVILSSKLSKLKKFGADHEKALLISGMIGTTAALGYNLKSISKVPKRQSFTDIYRRKSKVKRD